MPAVLAVVVVAFSLENPPRAAPQGLPADILFEGSLASSTVHAILQDAPDRRTGHVGDERAANRVGTMLRGFGFQVTHDRWNDGGTALDNVVARRAGLSESELVVLATRDALSVPDATGSAADTAALVEIGRALSARDIRHTMVFASVDGGSRGDVGARRFAAREQAEGHRIDALVVISNSGAARSRGPLVIDWATDARRGGLGLHRTAVNSLRAEVGNSGGGGPAGLAQIARLGFPVGIGAQGALLAEGLPAVRVSGSGELAPPPDRRRVSDFDSNRFGAMGRSVLRIVSALDAVPRQPPRGSRTYLTAGKQVLPGWAIALLAATLILPAFVASVDALARVRRRGHPVLRWFAWVAAGVVPFLTGLGIGKLLVVVGAARDAPAPLDPSAAPVNGRAAADIAGVVVAILLAWVLLRSPLLRRARPLASPAAPGAGVATALAMVAVTIGLCLVNPYAGLLVAVPLNLWMLATLSEMPPPRRAVLVALGLIPAALVVAVYMRELELGFLDAAWYLFLLVTGGTAGWVPTLLGCAVLGILASTIAIVVAHARGGSTEVLDAPPRKSVGSPSVTPRPGGRSVRRERLTT